MQIICADCRFFIPSQLDVAFHKCKATERFDLVTGQPIYDYCSIERNSTSPARCGQKGRHFELNMELEESNHGE